MLSVQDLHVSYGAVKAVKGVSFSVKKGEVVCLLGANGAGKTTILKTISGLLKPKQGQISFKGEVLNSVPAHLIVKRGLCQAPEGRGIFLNLSVEENLDLGAWAVKDKSTYQLDLERAFTLFPRLKERRKQNAGTLSGGEQQMLAIARSLMSHPECLLLDEPSLGLAPQVIERIFSVIQQINQQGVTILLVEQNAMQALSVSHRGLVLETGILKTSGDAKELLKSDEIRKAYLGE
ncbi:MAG: ABC transporter ATP-binding protein [Bdellovibrionales bacterium]